MRVEQRLVRPYERTGPNIAELRKAWSLVYPDHVHRSTVLMRQAFAASHQRDLDSAIRYGTEALELNPFFEQLRTYLRHWRSAQDL